MNTEPPQLVAHEATTRGVLAFLEFKDVEAFSTLCHFRAADGTPVPAWNPSAWWRSTLETWIDNSSREYDRAWTSPQQYVNVLEAELAHDLYDPLLLDADAWAARRNQYLLLFRVSELAGVPTVITPPPGCGEDEYQLRADVLVPRTVTSTGYGGYEYDQPAEMRDALQDGRGPWWCRSFKMPSTA